MTIASSPRRAGSCEDSWCWASTGSSEDCGLHTYHFAGGERIPELEEACFKAVARDAECGEHTVYEKCEEVATVESAEMVAVYECVSETACGDAIEDCSPEGKGALGAKICNAVDEACESESCSEEFRDVLLDASPWWRQDVIDGAKACLEVLRCRDMQSCLHAWSEVVLANGGFEDVRLWEL